jgi:metal-sulfur cluster biosynthetic enzyme
LIERANEALREVIDPELGISIVDLGLVYSVAVQSRTLQVSLTMTTAACPLAEQVVDEARSRLASIEGVEAVEVRLVWEPKWTPARMTGSAKATLGWPT